MAYIICQNIIYSCTFLIIILKIIQNFEFLWQYHKKNKKYLYCIYCKILVYISTHIDKSRLIYQVTKPSIGNVFIYNKR